MSNAALHEHFFRLTSQSALLYRCQSFAEDITRKLIKRTKKRRKYAMVMSAMSRLPAHYRQFDLDMCYFGDF